LTVWFKALWWVVAQKNGVSALGLRRVLGLGSYATAWAWLHKFRRLMVVPGRGKLSGRVEVDETYVGGSRPGKRGRGAYGKTLVGIAVELKEKGTGRIRLSVLPDASANSLKAFIEANIVAGSTVITDGWDGYNGTSTNGYQHEIETRTKVLDGRDILINAHRIAALLKRWLLGTHQNYVGKDQLRYYLDEYTFRYNRRTSRSRALLFHRLIEQAVSHEPVEFEELLMVHRAKR